MDKKKKTLTALHLFAAACAMAALLSLSAYSQDTAIRPAIVGRPMPDFTLPAFTGDALTLSDLKGKKVMVIFPRGFAAEGRWCTICNYKYAELVDLELGEQLRKKYNLEILYILPYDRDTVKAWLDAYPAQLEKIRGWKNPADPEKLDEPTKERMERSKREFPKDLSMKEGEVPAPFPILLDSERKVTRGLGLFMTEWGGSKVDQLTPSVYIIDKEGILQFKYIGQNTWDRPSYEYLTKILEILNKGL